MLVIRLTKIGKKNAPSYRIVLIEKTAATQSGKFLEILGNYNPRLIDKETGKKQISLKEDRIKYWLSQGVQTSETVHNLLVTNGVIEGPKIKRKIKKSKKTEEVKEEKVEKETEEKKEEKKEEPEKEESKPEEKQVDNSENKE